MIEGLNCPVCLKIRETNSKIANHKKKTSTTLKSKSLEIKKIKADSKAVIINLENLLKYYSENTQKVYEDAKKEIEVLK